MIIVFRIVETLSIISGLFVAATIVTSIKFSTPSISFNNCAKTRSPTLFPLFDELKSN